MTIGEVASEGGRDQTRQRVLEVALELMAKQGFAATSTREISERLGFTKAALYYHFRTKDELLGALVTPPMEQLAAMVDGVVLRAEAAPRRDLLASYVTFVAAHAELIRVLSQDPSVTDRPALLAAVPLYERLTKLLSGQQVPDVTMRTRVRAALGGIHAAIVHSTPHEDPDLVLKAALDAACGALGVPPLRMV